MRSPTLCLLSIGLLTAGLGMSLTGEGRTPSSEPLGWTQAAVPLPTAALAQAPAALSPRNANYSIDVELDPRDRTLTGREVLTWRNISNISTTELQFHLYYNAWKNTRSTWMRERLLGRGPAFHSRPEPDWGWIDVAAVRLLGAGDTPPIELTGHLRYISPDDGNPDDQTVLAVPLLREVGPGESVNIVLEWTSRIPRTFSRTGTIGNFFFLAQWFPKVGVLEETGWNCHQFHTATEFFADYGVYDVRITVPTAWVVGATGLRQDERDNADGTTTHRYYQEDVHDFAWTTSPDYLDLAERSEHPTLPDVDMRLLLQPEHAEQADRHFEATRAALRYYGEWYGPYPYGHVTVIDPAWQSDSDGMEYPTLFTAGARWLAPGDVTQPESVTVHETGHQFWYGIVANNEVEHAWLDEGLATFSTARIMAEAFMPRYHFRRYFGDFIPYVFRDIPWSRATDGNGLSQYRAAARMDVQATPTYQYWPGTAQTTSYNKTAVWLQTLERYLGWPTLREIMATFFDRWKFRHPTPQDFFDVASEVSEQDLGWFFDQVHGSSDVFDYGVHELRSQSASGRGFFAEDEAPTPTFTAESDSQSIFQTTVIVRRYGEAIFPVDVLVVFEDGEEVREQWDGRARWKAFTYERHVRAARAHVDPDRVLLMDLNYTNNSKTNAPKTAEATTKWMLKWMVWLQDFMLTCAFFI